MFKWPSYNNTGIKLNWQARWENESEAAKNELDPIDLYSASISAEHFAHFA